MNPRRRNFFIRKFTRGRVVPTISASVAWEIGGTTRMSVLRLPHRASNNNVRANRFSLKLNSWSIRSDQVLIDSDVPRQHVPESLRETRVEQVGIRAEIC
jgi:hypothetical protein